MRGVRPLQALRLATLGLLRRPGTAATAIGTLGLGLAVTVTLMGVGHGMLRPLPVPEGDEIVRIEVRDRQGSIVEPSVELLDAWRTGGAFMEGVEAFRVRPVVLGSGTRMALRRSSAALTPGAFGLLGVQPMRGRLPGSGPEDRDAVLLGAELAEAWLGGDEVLGTTVRLDGRPHTVVGVMPASFGFPYDESLWTVLHPEDGLEGAELFGRRGDGASEDEARVVLEATLPGTAAGVAPPVARASVRAFVGGRGESGELMALAGLGVLVGILLLVATANVSTLLQVRTAERAGSLAVHAALGAPRLQVALQLLLEAGGLAAMGGLLGLVGGYGLLSWIEQALAIHWGYHWMRMEVDPTVLAWTAGVVVLTAVLAGAAPAVRAMRTDLRGVLGGGRGRLREGSSSVGGWLVHGQLALSTAGLVAAVLLGLGVLRAGSFADRLPLDRVAVVRVPLDAVADDPGRWVATARALREALEEIPGVEAVSVGSGIPGFGGTSATVSGPGLAPGAPGTVVWTAVDDAHFDVYGLRLLEGRGFRASDGAGSVPVAVVNTTFVERLLTGSAPLGRGLRLGGVADEAELTVVGVVEDPFDDRPETARPRLYLPFAQAPAGNVIVSLRREELEGLSGLVGAAARGVDPDLPVEGVQSLRSFVDYLVRIPRTVGRFGFLGGVGTVLVAAVGLYGVLAFRVRSRLPELGVRMALGASRGRVVRDTLVGGLRVMLPGLAVGLVAGALLTPVLAAFLFGVRPGEPLAYVGVIATMLLVGLAAALGPAVRAGRSDPLAVLRSE